jgi:hypothetical protein
MFTRFLICVASILSFLAACTPAIPSPTGSSPAANETATASPVSESTSTPEPSRTPKPTATSVPLLLSKIDPLPDDCMDMEQNLPGEKLSEVAYLPSGFCFHGELDVFETGGRVYVAQVVQDAYRQSKAAFRIVDVTDVAQPVTVGAWEWSIPTYTADVKAFRQSDRWFLALSRDPSFAVDARLCNLIGGVAIIEVTDPASPQLLTVLNGPSTGGSKYWCNSHTAEVSRDADDNGAYIYVSAVDVFDLRVLDIRDLENVVEAGRYTHPDAGFYNQRNIFLVHDTTIVDDRVYVAYWSAGLIILDRETLEAGKFAKPLNPLDSIDPWGLQAHHAFPTTDGQFVFVEDEFNSTVPESRLRLYDIRDLQSPKEVAAITVPDSLGAPHNLLVSGNRLFVGWYQDGVRVFEYDTSDPEQPSVEASAFKSVRSRRTSNIGGDPYDGIWGVRLRECEVDGQPTICVFASDITYGLIILALEP